MFAFAESTPVPIGEWHCDKAKAMVAASAKGRTGWVTGLYRGQNLVWRIHSGWKSPPEWLQGVQGRETLGALSVPMSRLLSGALLLFRRCFCYGQAIPNPPSLRVLVKHFQTCSSIFPCWALLWECLPEMQWRLRSYVIILIYQLERGHGEKAGWDISVLGMSSFKVAIQFLTPDGEMWSVDTHVLVTVSKYCTRWKWISDTVFPSFLKSAVMMPVSSLPKRILENPPVVMSPNQNLDPQQFRHFGRSLQLSPHPATDF